MIMDKQLAVMLHLYTTKEELSRCGLMFGWTKENKPKGAEYHISVPLSICEVSDDVVRIYTSKLEFYV